MKTISTFIFVHKQEIILEYKEINKFEKLPNLKFVLVGKNNYDKVDNLEDVIICQKFEDNIEDYPQFTSYTGWYILWKNNLIDTDYVNLFEYDINIIGDVSNMCKEIQSNDFDFIGYLPSSVHESCYLKDSIWTTDMINSIKKNYSIDIIKIINQEISKNYWVSWSTTSNSTFSKKSFNEYMDWFDNIFKDLKNFKFGGHAHERSISFFYFIKMLNVKFYPNHIQHFQLNSHNTSPLPQNRFDNLYKNLIHEKSN